MSAQLLVIADVLQNWLDYQQEQWEREGNGGINDDVHFMTPPVYPTRGTLRNWITALRVETTAWLIERERKGRILYYAGGWEPDVNLATRFCRKEDAERLFSVFGFSTDLGMRVAEHMWLPAPTERAK